VISALGSSRRNASAKFIVGSMCPAEWPPATTTRGAVTPAPVAERVHWHGIREVVAKERDRGGTGMTFLFGRCNRSVGRIRVRLGGGLRW
jgi:hypothetical protein